MFHINLPLKWLRGALAITIFSLAVFSSAHASSDAPSTLEQLIHDFTMQGYAFYPMSATFNGHQEFNGQYAPPITAENLEARTRYYQSFLDALAKIDQANLNQEQSLTYSIFAYQLQQGIERQSLPEYLLSLNPVSGAHIHFAMLGSGMSGQPFMTEQDYRAFMRRSEGFSRWADSLIRALQKAAAQNQFIPKRTVTAVRQQLQQHLVETVTESVFYRPLTRLPEGLEKQAEEQLIADYTATIEQVILPTYQRLFDFFSNEYVALARDSIALQPDSTDWYSFYIKEHTTLNLSPNEVHQAGLREVAANRTQLEQLQKQFSFNGSTSEFLKHLRQDPQFIFSSAEELIEAYRHAAKVSQAQVQSLFNSTAPNNYQIAQVPDFAAQHAPKATYRPAAIDGSRPAMLYINAYDLTSQPSYMVDSTVLHEGSPGHHLQNVALQRNTTLSDYRKGLSFSAYDEGWGLYAETLGEELGLYATPAQQLGRILADQQRAVRLVVDTGIHAMGWSYETARAYILNHTALNTQEADAEIARYISSPGQALAYKVGEWKIRELRDFAATALGDAFSIRAFHDIILDSGSMPLTLLEQHVEAWVYTQLHEQGVNLEISSTDQRELGKFKVALLAETVNMVKQDVERLFVPFENTITVTLDIVDDNLDAVGGVTGIAMTPTRIELQLSRTSANKFDEVIETGLRATLYHEFHHLVRGWTVEGNLFGPGIPTAAVNEGLAIVFAEQMSGVEEPWLNYPPNVNDWLDEILALPLRANYQQWMMGTHPDGRQYIGYRVGKYIIDSALKSSQKSIVELTTEPVDALLNMVKP